MPVRNDLMPLDEMLKQHFGDDQMCKSNIAGMWRAGMDLDEVIKEGAT